MSGLEELGAEIAAARVAGAGGAAHDIVRRRHLRRMAAATGNHAVIYASSFVQRPSAPEHLRAIVSEDVHGFMSALRGADRAKGLDLIVHSPGGSPEAAEEIANYLHAHLDGRRLRVIVPHSAMSAATMLACGADAVVMGEHSSLGPVDPQLRLGHPAGWRVSAHELLGEFEWLLGLGPGLEKAWEAERAKRGAESGALPVFGAPGNVSFGKIWADAVLTRYPAGLTEHCRRLIAMSEKMTGDLLRRRMFSADARRAKKLAAYLANHSHFMSHSRRISRADALRKGMKVEKLEEQPEELQDAVLSVFYALCLTFSDTRAAKIIESDSGRLFARLDPGRQIP